MELEKDLEKAVILFFESAGVMVFKPSKASDRKHASRKVDLGAPDLWLFSKSFCVPVELKVGYGKQSEDQIAFESRLRHHGMPYYIVRSMDDADNVLTCIRMMSRE